MKSPLRLLDLRLVSLTATVLASAVVTAHPAAAQERLCDASVENCRVPLVDLIDNEQVAIDVAFWFIKDGRIPAALVRAHDRGVPIRVIMDTRANDGYPENEQYLQQLADAGIPMRTRTGSGIAHWKLMIFAGQGTIEWSGANYSPTAFVPITPYQNYEDEVIYFSKRLVTSFMRKYDDEWTNTRSYGNYANISGPLQRLYPTYAIDPRLNFVPTEGYQDRLVPLIDSEPPSGLIDVDMYRVTQSEPVDALIRAASRGVRQRLYLEPNEYNNPDRPDNKTQIDRLVDAAERYPGTIEIRMRAHAGLNHQKTVWLHSQRIVVFGTSNWSRASDTRQLESNIFTAPDPGDSLNDFLFTELERSFERKFYNEAPDGSIESTAFRTPSLPRPTNEDLCNDPSATNYGGPAPCRYPAPTLPSEWDTRDIGAVGLAGSAGESNGSFTVKGSGADIWGTADAFRYAYQPLAGDGTIVARLATVESVNRWTKAGVMIRQSLDASSAHAAMFVTPGKGLAFQRRPSFGASSVNTAIAGTAPEWVRLVRVGQTVTASVSGDGSSWTTVGRDTIALSGVVWVGLAVTSHDNTQLATAAFDHVVISTDADSGDSLPTPWIDTDIGAGAGSASFDSTSATFSVTGQGEDIWFSADAFHYVYQTLNGDGTIVARVSSVENSSSWAKAGVMIRNSTAADSTYAYALVSVAKGVAFQRRATTGADAAHTGGSGASAPHWISISRTGNTFTAAESSDGNSWTTIGSETIAMDSSVLVGLAVTSHNRSEPSTATFDQVVLSGSGG
jgi:phosphatidylserine/phosphatidylglycerophosphate/cardiolipin synthase-like enzyme/regulation of enolase protein 1 (concanavalin A-like superfamily)